MQNNGHDEDIVIWTKSLHKSINSLNIHQLEDILVKLNTTKGLEFAKNVINHSINGENSVYIAVEAGFDQAVKQLLNTDMVNIIQRNPQNNWTSLHLACYLGLATIVKSLLNCNTSNKFIRINELYQLICMQTAETESTSQGTALHLAVYSKNIETVNQLLHDVDLISKCYESQCIENGKQPKEAMNSKGKLFDEFCVLTDKNGNTALHCAVMDKLYDIVNTICKYHNKSIRLPNKHGYTCIYLAKNVLKDVKMVSLLVKYSTSSITSGNPGHHSFKQNNSIKSARVSCMNQLNKKDNKKSHSNLIKKSENNGNYKKLKKFKYPLNHLTIDQLNKNLNSKYIITTNNNKKKWYAYSYEDEENHSVRTLSTKISYLSMQQKSKKSYRPFSGLSGNRVDLNEREFNRNSRQNIEQSHIENIYCGQNRNNSIQYNGSNEPCLATCKNDIPFATTLQNNLILQPENIDQLAHQKKKESEDKNNRSGCDIDEKSLENVFGSFNFLVKLLRNLSAGEIQAQLEHLGKKTNHHEYDCLVICLMSHGTIGRIYGVDGNSLSIHELTSIFTADNCPSLAGKPKLFFIQACRGEDYQKGYVIQKQSNEITQTNNDITNQEDNLIPTYADFLLSYATVAGFRAQRDPTGGTVYIQALCKRLHNGLQNESILDIVTAVHREVSKQLYQETSFQLMKTNGELFLQIPEVRHTLTKKVCFKR
ncbi:subfamily C14A unassigned peptidase (C14 family) [Schistosoma mansoni]|uniref:subfamily C14A unassigned peptidase (C14 family) n=1 Tax=Schistosoma mansoni TaxID=6183 RepID=UPI0001A94219|nr:subfamily C14A unassigned peptidase (C14 family) [Schistosoma mansoni]|eukprot:XP_018647858.1 subfamily C14A unassigned peptidase (C14 family) [Schistosoma mansoni]